FEKAFAGISDSSERDHLASNYAMTLIIPWGKLEESPAILEHSMLLISWIEAESTRDKLWSILGDKLMRSHSLGNSLDAFLRINDAQSRDEKLLRLVDQALQEGLQHLALDSAREIKDPATREKALVQARS
ncbi:MAG: hypothetical protein KDK78_06225, partial [Chlamydiia bacterium]|nr:hypothetical protein [Chlamydiia bacterium]